MKNAQILHSTIVLTCMQTLGDCGGLDEVAGTQLARDVLIDASQTNYVLHKKDCIGDYCIGD